MSNSPILKLENITKKFAGVEVLHGIQLQAEAGEVHALVGENGAGKSTLMKILSGVYPKGEYGGRIFIDGREAVFANIKDAENTGIEIITQELELVPQLPVYENVYLGSPVLKKGMVDASAMISGARRIFERLGVSIDAATPVDALGVGHRQMVAIAKALRTDARIIIFDEPTAALSDTEADKLFSVISELKQKGITILYISHRLKEVLKISDKVTVLRDGRTIITEDTSRLDEAQLVLHMIGRELTEQFPRREANIGDVIFEAKDICSYDGKGKKLVKDVSFSVHRGEIFGIAGLVGAGRSELARSLFGAMEHSGEMYLEGEKLDIRRPMDAIGAGIGLVSEDRKADGFVPMLSLADNISLASLKALSKGGVIDNSKYIKASEAFRSKLRIRSNNIYQSVDGLSGGNQQKVCIAKLLLTSPRLLILDEPTRGVDVGAKYEIYSLIDQLVSQGIAVVLISSELPEIFGMADRIMVMSNGRNRAILKKADTTQAMVMHYATIEGD